MAMSLAGILVGTLHAQNFAPSEPLRLAIDYARYRGNNDSTVFVEVYYSFPERSITYKPDTSGYKGFLDLTFLFRRGDSTAAADRWLVPHIIPDTTQIARGMNLVGVYKIMLDSGSYALTVIGRDRNAASRTDSLTMRLPIKPAGTARVSLSDIEFASSIRPDAQQGGTFYKNTLDVVPNATGIFSDAQPGFIYAESYNLLAGDDKSDYTLRLSVFDAVNREVVSRDKVKKRTVDASVIVDNLNVHKLRSGTYTAVLIIADSTGKAIAATGKKFYVYNPRLGVDSTLMNAGSAMPLGVFMSMEEPELDREFRWLRYEAQDVEKSQYASLSGVDAKRKFLSDFWRRRSPEMREEYLKRVAYANANYAAMGREGYRTDRGRVYIMYGPPDDNERHPNESDMRPYEIWSYHNIQGGVIFVFVQRSSTSEYELVHSTHRNELHDENWDRVGITR